MSKSKVMGQPAQGITRRSLGRSLLTLTTLRLFGQTESQTEHRPDSFRVYTDTPRLLLRPARLRLLRRERERRSLRWEQFETLWTSGADFPEFGWAQALRFRIADDHEAGVRAVAWAAGPAEDIRQIALISDWCAPLVSKDDFGLIATKLRRAAAGPVRNIADARTRVFAAIALSDSQPDAAGKALESVIDGFWNREFIPSLRDAKLNVPNPDAYAMLETMHAVRDNLNFDLRETFPQWFEQYPVMHLMAHYSAPWPEAGNEFHIPADTAIESRGPDTRKAALSRAAELAMVAFDANTASSQLLQGWVMNDRFLMRGAFGLPYELFWANPYQPGLSYERVPLAFHDQIGGQLFVRSSWEDDAAWAGYFNGQLQLFKDGTVTRIDPLLAREPLDLDSAAIFFGRETKKFRMPAASEPNEDSNVFIVGLDARQGYHIEIDGEEMFEERADPGGIMYLSGVPGAAGVRIGPAPARLPPSAA